MPVSFEQSIEGKRKENISIMDEENQELAALVKKQVAIEVGRISKELETKYKNEGAKHASSNHNETNTLAISRRCQFKNQKNLEILSQLLIYNSSVTRKKKDLMYYTVIPTL